MSPAKVLIVEDNKMNMELATDLLTLLGHDVLQASTGFDAIALLRDTKPDLILMDLQLPGLSGFDLTRSLKRDPRTRDIPITAMTADAMKEDAERAFEAGCSGYIPKPIECDQFRQVVDEVLKDDENKAAG